MKGVRVSFTTSPQIARDLDALLATGLYGRCRAHVAERLMARAMLEALEILKLRGKRIRNG